MLELPRDPALPDATEPGAEAAADVKGETDDALESTDDGDVLAAEAADVLEPETAALGATEDDANVLEAAAADATEATKRPSDMHSHATAYVSGYPWWSERFQRNCGECECRALREGALIVKRLLASESGCFGGNKSGGEVAGTAEQSAHAEQVELSNK